MTTVNDNVNDEQEEQMPTKAHFIWSTFINKIWYRVGLNEQKIKYLTDRCISRYAAASGASKADIATIRSNLPRQTNPNKMKNGAPEPISWKMILRYFCIMNFKRVKITLEYEDLDGVTNVISDTIEIDNALLVQSFSKDKNE